MPHRRLIPKLPKMGNPIQVLEEKVNMEEAKTFQAPKRR